MAPGHLYCLVVVNYTRALPTLLYLLLLILFYPLSITARQYQRRQDPYKVLQRYGVNYSLVDMAGNLLSRNVHGDRLMPFFWEDENDKTDESPLPSRLTPQPCCYEETEADYVSSASFETDEEPVDQPDVLEFVETSSFDNEFHDADLVVQNDVDAATQPEQFPLDDTFAGPDNMSALRRSARAKTLSAKAKASLDYLQLEAQLDRRRKPLSPSVRTGYPGVNDLRTPSWKYLREQVGGTQLYCRRE